MYTASTNGLKGTITMWCNDAVYQNRRRRSSWSELLRGTDTLEVGLWEAAGWPTLRFEGRDSIDNFPRSGPAKKSGEQASPQPAELKLLEMHSVGPDNADDCRNGP